MSSHGSAQLQEEEHDMWDPVIGLCCHFHVGKHIEEVLTEEEMERITSPRPSVLDILCDKGDQQDE